MMRVYGRRVLACVAIGTFTLGPPARTAEDPQVDQLRSDVRMLEREVRELSRRVDQLQQGQSSNSSAPAVTRRSTVPDPDPGAWLPPEKWDRVRAGMTAQQVILVLGAPVSMRPGTRPGTQTLFYTLPVGDGGFLTGAVRLENDKVLEVEKPVLKEAAKSEAR